MNDWGGQGQGQTRKYAALFRVRLANVATTKGQQRITADAKAAGIWHKNRGGLCKFLALLTGAYRLPYSEGGY